MKNDLKNTAIELRKRGLTYSEILAKIPVAKSTLSIWLRSVSLAKRQQQRLTEKKWEAIRKGGAAKKQIKLDKIAKIHQESALEIKYISDRDLFMLGIALYWAEGSKEKEYSSTGIKFINSDVAMIKIFILWLRKFLAVRPADLIYELYIHRTAAVAEAILFWSRQINIPGAQIRVYFKSANTKSKRKNIGDNYHGLLRVNVRKSLDLNRKIAGWINGLINGII